MLSAVEHVLWLCNFRFCKAIPDCEAALFYCKATPPRAHISEIEAAYIRRKCISKWEPRQNQYKISTASVIDNLEVNRLQWRMLLKRRERGKGKLLKLQGVARGKQEVVVRCASGVAQ